MQSYALKLLDFSFSWDKNNVFYSFCAKISYKQLKIISSHLFTLAYKKNIHLTPIQSTQYTSFLHEYQSNVTCPKQFLNTYRMFLTAVLHPYSYHEQHCPSNKASKNLCSLVTYTPRARELKVAVMYLFLHLIWLEQCNYHITETWQHFYT